MKRLRQCAASVHRALCKCRNIVRMVQYRWFMRNRCSGSSRVVWGRRYYIADERLLETVSTSLAQPSETTASNAADTRETAKPDECHDGDRKPEPIQCALGPEKLRNSGMVAQRHDKFTCTVQDFVCFDLSSCSLKSGTSVADVLHHRHTDS